MICFVSECGRVTTGGVAGSVPATAWGHVTVPPHYTHYTAHYTPNTLYSTWSPPELQTNICEERARSFTITKKAPTIGPSPGWKSLPLFYLLLLRLH